MLPWTTSLSRIYLLQAVKHLNWEDRYGASTPNRPSTNGFIERTVRTVKGGTSATLLQSGANPEWWANAMRYSTFVRKVTDKLIDDLSGGLKKAPGAVPILPPVDSLKMIDWANERLVSTLPRAEIGRVRTPQAFDFETIIGLHEQMEGENLPDDAELLLKAGLDVTLVACSEALIKVTVKEDLEILSALIQKDSPNYEYRSGIGFDVHAFDEQTDRPLVLCGVKFENHRPLKGHSDADVALHTITDALLGAIAEGDIGTHFPPSEAKWKGMDSAVFLEHAVTLVNERHGKITSVDLTVICESPKVTPRRQEMRERLAEIMKLNINRVSVKGTTTEKLGFAGRGEGIAAQASVTVALPLERSL